MKAAELRDLPVEELDRRASEMRENIFNLRIRHAAGTLDSSADLSKHKRDLARVLTVLNERKRAAPKQPASAPKQQAAAQEQAPAPEKALR